MAEEFEDRVDAIVEGFEIGRDVQTPSQQDPKRIRLPKPDPPGALTLWNHLPGALDK